ncbi:vacuolar protein 8-like [Platysternon megacephalum]|uniref:Vacuolar protein 8-like n=1 Tax=Platysternon megacephalum TaxID=55544 RepID=A0A4D9EG53_9SAUR|nr:vacuolar protein 8-like [Platysternon megacephalum]
MTKLSSVHHSSCNFISSKSSGTGNVTDNVVDTVPRRAELSLLFCGIVGFAALTILKTCVDKLSICYSKRERYKDTSEPYFAAAKSVLITNSPVKNGGEI